MTKTLISCICVTRKRPLLLQRAIACFDAQTYAHKELVLLYESDDQETEAVVRLLLPRADITVIRMDRTERRKLGYLRNKAIDAAKGMFVCQWDDDDWHHAERLTCQYGAVRSRSLRGCILSRWVIFDSLSGRAYLSSERPWEGSLLCERSLLLENRYENLAKGEDTPVIRNLYERHLLIPMPDKPYLYIYVAHGRNTWERNHFCDIFRYGRRLQESSCRLIADALGRESPVRKYSVLLSDLFTGMS